MIVCEMSLEASEWQIRKIQTKKVLGERARNQGSSERAQKSMEGG